MVIAAAAVRELVLGWLLVALALFVAFEAGYLVARWRWRREQRAAQEQNGANE